MFQRIQSGLPVVARAIVVSNADPDGLGRVRVRYPWLSQAGRDLASDWADVIHAYASKEVGIFCVPEKGDEVLVCFENDSLKNPLILGSLYNKRRMPPTAHQSKEDSSSVRLLRTKSGHSIIFNDSDDQAGILIESPNQRKIEIHNQNPTIRIISSKSQIILDQESITIESGGNRLELKTDGIEIRSNGEIRLGGQANQSVIKGNQFMELFNSHTHPTPTGTSGPPTVPLNSSVMTQKVKIE